MKLRYLLPVIAVIIAAFLISPAGGVPSHAKPSPKPSPSPSVSPSPSPTATPPPPTGWDNEKAFGTGDDWEPDVAFDPSSNYAYMATTRYGGTKACKNCPAPALILRVSTDNGVTWGAESYICACSGTKAQNDPELEVGSDGTIYATWLNDYNPGVVFSKSTDHGATWTAPVSLKGSGLSFSDKPIMAISPTGRDIYIAWNSSDSYMSVSHDFGATFAARAKTNTDSLYWFAEGGVVAPNGNVFFSESAENQSATGQVKLAVLKSTDLGATWNAITIDTSEEQPPCTVTGCSADFYASQADIAVDSTGKLVVAYTANTTAQANKSLWVKSSTDDGGTWSARVLVNSQGDNGFPKIDNGPSAGDFRLAWQDSRGGAYNTYYKRSTNGGSTWTADVKLSNLTGGAPYKSSAGYTFPYGDYFGFATDTTGLNLAAWGEGPNYSGPGGTWYTKGQ